MKYLTLISLLLSHASMASLCSPGLDTRHAICAPGVARGFATKSKLKRPFIRLPHSICTFTMISDECAISAGHCKDTKFIEFNTLSPGIDGRLRFTGGADFFRLDKSSIQLSADRMLKDDWMVVKVLPNELTGQHAGMVHGIQYIDMQPAVYLGQKLELLGYGSSDSKGLNYVLKRSEGSLVKFNSKIENYFGHTMDSTGGDSGAGIYSASTGKIVGIHTGGGCSNNGSNVGITIGDHAEFKKAIRACLRN